MGDKMIEDIKTGAGVLALLIGIFALIYAAVHLDDKAERAKHVRLYKSGLYIQCGNSKWKYMEDQYLFGNNYDDMVKFRTQDDAKLACSMMMEKK